MQSRAGVNVPPVGSRRRLVIGLSLGKPYPNVEVEVVGKPRSGDYKAGQPLRRVKIGTVAPVRFLGSHDCPPGCSPPQHEILARLDQLVQP